MKEKNDDNPNRIVSEEEIKDEPHGCMDQAMIDREAEKIVRAYLDKSEVIIDEHIAAHARLCRRCSALLLANIIEKIRNKHASYKVN